jgi:hypothetical protein
MRTVLLGMAAIALLGLGACEGVNEGRVARDAGIGALGGAVVGGALGRDPVEGAIVGGALGGGYGIYRENRN